jgi:hypothetical protein
MRKKGIGWEMLALIILALVGFLLVLGFATGLFQNIMKSHKGDINLCRTFICGSEEVEKKSAGFISAKPSSFCKTQSVEIPQYSEDKSKEGITKEIMRLVSTSWYEMCDGPDDSAWAKWQSIFSKKNCFPTFYFTIKKVYGFGDKDVLTAQELDWALATEEYKKLPNDEGGMTMYTYTAYVQYYATAGRIDVLTNFTTNEIYAIAVATPQGIKGLRGEDNIPHVVITKAVALRGVCDDFS